MPLAAYRFRFRHAHVVTLLCTSLALMAALVFVLGRIFSGRRPTPANPEYFVSANVDTKICDCACEVNSDSLICYGRQPNNHSREQFAPLTINEDWDALHRSGCINIVVSQDSYSQAGLPYEFLTCSCADAASRLDESIHCRIRSSYSEQSIQMYTNIAIFEIIVACVALLWDLQYLIGIYWRVVPSAPQDAIHMEWFQRWLSGFWDPLHSTAMWCVWTQILAVSFAPPGGPSPSPRDYVTPEVREAAGWAPTGLDELVLWVALSICALAVALLTCTIPSSFGTEPGDQIDGAPQQGSKTSSDEEFPTRQQRSTLLLLLPMASIGCLLGQPISCIYAIIISVPAWLIHAQKSWKAPWPLDRPFPACGDPWVIPAWIGQKHNESIVLLEQLDIQKAVPNRNLLQNASKLRSLCRTVADIQRAQPWRASSDLETRLRSAVLDALQRAIELRHPSALGHLFKTAVLLGYVEPPEEDNEESEEEPLEAKRAACCCPMGYQQLKGGTIDKASGHLLARDEKWCLQVQSSIQAALQSAIESARLLEDEASSHWLGACMATSRPGPIQELASQLARAADYLKLAKKDETWERHELFRLVATAAGLHPDVEGTRQITAFGWGLRLPYRESKGPMSLMLQHLPQGPVPETSEQRSAVEGLVVLTGNTRSTIIDGYRFVACRNATVGAPGFAVPPGPGRWFFEAHVFGHNSVCSRAGELPTLSRIGWLHHDRALMGLAGHNATSQRNNDTDLGSATSCSLDMLSMGPKVNSARASASQSAPGSCVIGCTLQVSMLPNNSESYKACFAVDGDWGVVDSGTVNESMGFCCRTWCSDPARSGVSTRGSSSSAQISQRQLIPSISGSIACQFIFNDAAFNFGPPDSSFLPLDASGMEEHSETRVPHSSLPQAQSVGRGMV